VVHYREICLFLEELRPRIPLVRLCPAVTHLLPPLRIIAHLDRKIRVRMPIVKVPPLMFLEKLDQNFFIIPRLNR
jgi:hypothetical protein